MPEPQALHDIRGIDVHAAMAEVSQIPRVRTTRCITPYIQKSWKRTWASGKKEAEKQAASAYPGSRVQPTGRTFHSPTDWAFEFEVIESKGGGRET